MTTLTITTLADRPELTDRLYEVQDTWPQFMDHDVIANALFYRVAADFPQFCVIATDQDGTLVARGRSVPFRLGGPAYREQLPDGGWDHVLAWAYDDLEEGTQANAASALDIAVSPSHRGAGLSHRILAALREAVARQGIGTLYAPVRPTEKHLMPNLPMAQYITRTDPEGLPADAWLRVHARAGAVIEKVAPASMVVTGSLTQWRSWTGLPFDVDGDVVVPEALVPVRCNLAHDYAVYVEPNVWMRHDLT